MVAEKSFNKIFTHITLFAFTAVQIFNGIPILFAQELIQTPQGYIAEKAVNLSEISASLGIAPNQNLTPNDVTELPRDPFIMRIGDREDIDLEKTDRGVKVHYDFESSSGCLGGSNPGQLGVRLSFDNPSTAATETIDLSTYPKLVLGLKGTPSTVSFRISDTQGHTAIFYLEGISNEERLWSITSSEISEKGIDLSKIWAIDIIIEDKNPEEGVLEVMLTPPQVLPATNLTLADITVPSSPAITLVKPEGNASSITYTGRGVILNYITAGDGWAGGGFSYDDFSTPAIETQDLSSVSELVFGLKNLSGNLERVKLEFVDDQNRKGSIYLSGISTTEQVWRIERNVLLATGIDATKIRLIYFIVEGANQTGTLEINRVPAIPPSSTLTTTDITDVPEGQVWGGYWIPGGVRILVDTDNDPNHPGFDFGGFHYDDFSTPAIESKDLSGFSELVFGLKRTGGDYDEVKFELTDDQGRKAYVYLTGVSDTEKFWLVPTAALTMQGVDLSKISIVVVVIEKPHQTGTLDFNYTQPPATASETQMTTTSASTQSTLSPLQTLVRIAELLDRNKDSTVSASEVFAVMREYKALFRQSSLVAVESNESLRPYDVNGNGLITVTDMTATNSAAKSTFLRSAELRMVYAFEAADQNHDYILMQAEADLANQTILGKLGKVQPGVNDAYDFNKNGFVTATDIGILRITTSQFAVPNDVIQAASNPNFAFRAVTEPMQGLNRYLYVIDLRNPKQEFLVGGGSLVRHSIGLADVSPDGTVLTVSYNDLGGAVGQLSEIVFHKVTDLMAGSQMPLTRIGPPAVAQSIKFESGNVIVKALLRGPNYAQNGETIEVTFVTPLDDILAGQPPMPMSAQSSPDGRHHAARVGSYLVVIYPDGQVVSQLVQAPEADLVSFNLTNEGIYYQFLQRGNISVSFATYDDLGNRVSLTQAIQDLLGAGIIGVEFVPGTDLAHITTTQLDENGDWIVRTVNLKTLEEVL